MAICVNAAGRWGKGELLPGGTHRRESIFAFSRSRRSEEPIEVIVCYRESGERPLGKISEIAGYRFSGCFKFIY